MGSSPEGSSLPRPLAPLGEVELKNALKKAHDGDPAARELVVRSHLRLVWNIVRRFHGHGGDADDLFQLGCLGLVKALDRYDPSFGTRFSTYAVPLILGEIRRFLRDDSAVSVPRRAKDIARQAWRAEEELTKSLGRAPTAAEIARNLGVDAADVAESLEAAKMPLSLFGEVLGEGGDDTLYLIDQLAAKGDVAATVAGHPSPGSADAALEESLSLREAVSRLDDRTRALITMRFFEEKTQAEVGAALGVSQVQVSRLEKQALLRLKRILAD